MDQDRLFDLCLDRNNYLEWKSGYSAVELISGMPGEEGLKFKLIFNKRGGDKQAVIETITKVNRPFEYVSECSTDGMIYFYKCRLIGINKNTTRIIVEGEVKPSSLFLKIILPLISPIIKWQFKKVMKQFKEFAERSNPA